MGVVQVYGSRQTSQLDEGWTTSMAALSSLCRPSVRLSASRGRVFLSRVDMREGGEKREEGRLIRGERRKRNDVRNRPARPSPPVAVLHGADLDRRNISSPSPQQCGPEPTLPPVAQKIKFCLLLPRPPLSLRLPLLFASAKPTDRHHPTANNAVWERFDRDANMVWNLGRSSQNSVVGK